MPDGVKWDYKTVRRFCGKEEARVHDYKMMRLNDLVDRWIDLQI